MGKRIPNKCGKCGQQDTFEHLVGCLGLKMPDHAGGSGPAIQLLLELANKASQIGPARQVARPTPTEQRHDLDSIASSDSEHDSLVFDVAT